MGTPNSWLTKVSFPIQPTDPVSPVNGDAWILGDGTPGSPLGLLLCLTHANYQISASVSYGIARVTVK